MTTMGAYEGDLVRPLGFVTLYFAYAEGCLDEVYEALRKLSGSKKHQALSFGSKLTETIKLIDKIGSHNFPDLYSVLQDARPIVQARNELVHGQLFNGGRLVTRLGTRQVNPKEIEELAELIFSWKERLWVKHCRELLPRFK